jgi:D-glycero-alpha-D-manno-heptose-7-phosphate kinase
MHITKSPMRITFLGGGTDYESFFKNHSGASIFATIDKFVYVSTINQPIFVEDLYKFTYRKTEGVANFNEIEHPVVKAILNEFKWDTPINIATMADLPESSGLGSSSAFTAALYQNLATRKGLAMDSINLARKAISIERQILQEPGGWQDQISTVYGGLRIINFSSRSFVVSNSILDNALKEFLSTRLILIRTNLVRRDMRSADLTEKLVQKNEYMQDLIEIVEESKRCWSLMNKLSKPEYIFEVLMQAIQTSWKYKSKWGNHILSSEVESIIENIESFGDMAYKLVGAGGGGFLLVAANPEVILKIKSSFASKDYINFSLYDQGTTTVANV